MYFTFTSIYFLEYVMNNNSYLVRIGFVRVYISDSRIGDWVQGFKVSDSHHDRKEYAYLKTIEDPICLNSKKMLTEKERFYWVVPRNPNTPMVNPKPQETLHSRYPFRPSLIRRILKMRE